MTLAPRRGPCWRSRSNSGVSSATVLGPARFDLRHTHAALLIDLDAHPKPISERIGHAEVGDTMDVYGHLDVLVERARQLARPDSSAVAIRRSM